MASISADRRVGQLIETMKLSTQPTPTDPPASRIFVRTRGGV
jgi:hypothetical protein